MELTGTFSKESLLSVITSFGLFNSLCTFLFCRVLWQTLLITWLATGLIVHAMVVIYRKTHIYNVSANAGFAHTAIHMAGCLTEPEQGRFLPKDSAGTLPGDTHVTMAIF